MPILDFLLPKNEKKQKVILLGSGALSIGQAGEFDYSGSQAVEALEEEGLEVIVINPNIASVQTNKAANKRVYLYPVTPFWVEKIIKIEKPAAIISSFGGQTSLNCVIELEKSGILKKYNVKVLGTQVNALEMSEDRELFAQKMKSIDAPVAKSHAVSTVKEALETAEQIGYPVITRSAFALGGLGSGLAATDAELKKLTQSALMSSPQVLIEKSLHGWKEIEYEVMRDKTGNTITICNMENFDPMGIHTGDSIVIAPCQTINNIENNMLRDMAIKIAQNVGIVGECNVQYALNPKDYGFYVIEINARLSRSSALASKATGYPIAYIAAKIVIGFDLLELKNPVTGTTSAFYEPSLDYVTLKVPRWDLSKFSGVSKNLGTQMKSVGEVMAIGRNFCEVIQKALRMVNENEDGITVNFFKDASDEDIEKELLSPTNLRVFAIYETFKRGKSLEYVYEKTKIDYWFLSHILYLAKIEKELLNFFKPNVKKDSVTVQELYDAYKQIPKDFLQHLKSRGFSDFQLVKIYLLACLNSKIKLSIKEIRNLSFAVRKLRKKLGILPVVKQIDTTSSEYPTKSNYLYLTYDGIHSDVSSKKNEKSIITLGSGSYRIGSSLEFDWCSVMTSSYFKNKKNDSVIINCNPETVSTDYNASDRLYFEELSFERVLDIIDIEDPKGVIACMGGQNPNNLIQPLSEAKVNILGHSQKSVAAAEDREKFSATLDKLGIDQPEWISAVSIADIDKFIKKIGFPVLIRPSFVLSGTLMNVATDKKSLDYYLSLTRDISFDFPVVISKFILDAKEIECDGVAKNGDVILSIVSEHIENAGVHSGDATMVFPARKIYVRTVNIIKDIVRKIAKGLNLNGPFNIQFIAKDNDVKVIECNARASRSFPFISKVSGVNLAEISCKVMNNERVKKILIDESEIPYVGVKASMFSFQRLDGADPVVGVEMSSTGEVGCLGEKFNHAMLLSMEATRIIKPQKGVLLSTGREKDKVKFMEVVDNLYKLGIPVYATKGSARYLEGRGYSVNTVHWNRSSRAVDVIIDGKVDFVININKNLSVDEINNNSEIRKTAVKFGCSILTNLEKAIAYLRAYDSYDELQNIENCIGL
ncbi:carbamoyl-phosphate synthase (glutamine-hydrolyzing) large subunit [Candidatus Endomicrobiellum trichonymphae]|uniref:Carbamoyl phosphate synthase arginine-specific large chain n=1 Tax=Endomicrobium trichonymphae TaxID=1408204 RepID=B1GZG6_ENDTX|nr:carbamoyl-phosphate synthase (glutamine-hydrolyzing) large subunit [Candidatus Endomicrobium trichonymphae]BAG13648.1 carbamoyl-phosphate synthase arginine-specific large chain [Candidatus Endomicrobium trichonymphae]